MSRFAHSVQSSSAVSTDTGNVVQGMVLHVAHAHTIYSCFRLPLCTVTVESCVCFVHAAPELLHIVIEAGHIDGHPPWLWVGACSSRPVGRMGVVPGSSCVWPC